MTWILLRSPPFLRRCLRLRIKEPEKEKLVRILTSHIPLDGSLSEDQQGSLLSSRGEIIKFFLQRRSEGEMATDQLMNAIFMVSGGLATQESEKERKDLIQQLLRPLSSKEPGS